MQPLLSIDVFDFVPGDAPGIDQFWPQHRLHHQVTGAAAATVIDDPRWPGRRFFPAQRL